MTISRFDSSMSSAPVMTGQTGQGIAVVKACLVTGFGAASAAGWAEEFSGTNLSVLRSPSGNRLRLRLDDTGASSARSMRACGYETMSGVSTGSDLFPTSVQLANAIGVFKSGTTDSTARPWRLFADERMFYLFVQAEAVSGEWHMFGFGEIVSYGTGDSHATIILGATENAAAATLDDNHPAGLVQALTTQTSHYLARAYNLASGAVACGKHSDVLAGTVIGAGLVTFPAPIDTGLHVASIKVHEAATPRGVLPGLYAPLHSKPIADGTIITDDITGLEGRDFFVQDLASPTGTATGQILIDITGPWR